MAKCGVTNIGGGGGIGSDEVSAAKENVLSGKTYVGADTGDEIGTGTMANNGATGNQSLNAGSSFLVKKGYHAQDFSVGANSLASQTPGTADNGSVLSGRSAWVNGNRVNGSIPWQNADVSGTDRAWATNISCWEGVACLGVRNAYYLNGVNWIQGNIPNFYADNIKKGVNMGGVVGKFEGYVPISTDLYLRGNNVAGWEELNGARFDTGQITSYFYNFRIATAGQINLTGHNYLNIQGYAKGSSNKTWSVSLSSSSNKIFNSNLTTPGDGNFTWSFNITNYNMTSVINIFVGHLDIDIISSSYYMAIYRIWFS